MISQLIRNIGNCLSFSLLICLFCCGTMQAQTTSFTYQGRLTDNTIPANGNYQMQFALYDLSNVQVTEAYTNANVHVVNGIFTVTLDFGAAAFPGADRFLQIAVFSAATSSFVTLTPRQPIMSSPYAIRSLNTATADTAINSQKLGGVSANQFVQTSDARMANARDPLAGSSNYIQNSTSQQTLANFNISGNGAANFLTAINTVSGNGINSQTTYSIGGSRVLSVGGTNNLFAGISAGSTINSGSNNSFVGASTGTANTVGSNNSFVGFGAGNKNTQGDNNAFFGSGTGMSNTTGSSNSFIGAFAGFSNVGGSGNSFVGSRAGLTNSSGSNNSFFGYTAGISNISGGDNVFVGFSAGSSNTTGSSNSFVGSSAGSNNSSGSANAFFGVNAGSQNTTATDNSFFGALAGADNTTGNRNSFFGKGVGSSNKKGSNNSFVGWNAGSQNVFGDANVFVGSNAGVVSTSDNNSLVGKDSGLATTTGSGNSFFGERSGFRNITGSNNTAIGQGATVSRGDINFGTAIGAGAAVSSDNTIVLGRIEDTVKIPHLLKLDVLDGYGTTPLCRNSSGNVSMCSASKPAVSTENTAGLNVIRNQNEAMQLQLTQQSKMIDGLRKLVCLQNSQADVCKEIK